MCWHRQSSGQLNPCGIQKAISGYIFFDTCQMKEKIFSPSWNTISDTDTTSERQREAKPSLRPKTSLEANQKQALLLVPEIQGQNRVFVFRVFLKEIDDLIVENLIVRMTIRYVPFLSR